MDIFFNIIKAIFYGIIQGITEWLPISSTGHLIIFEELFPFINVSDGFLSMLRVVVQLGSILAVVVLYFNKLNPWGHAANGTRKSLEQRNSTLRLWILVIIGCLPAAIVGIPFNDAIDSIFFNFPVVATMLLVYGVAFIIIENLNRQGRLKTRVNSFAQLDIKTAALIGVFQMMAMIPGTSRSGATIVGALLLGCSRGIAAEFSFFMSIPTMLGASGVKCLKYLKDLIESGTSISGVEITVFIISIIVSFVVSLFAIRFLIGYIKKHDFKPFGYYRVGLAIILFFYFILHYVVKVF